MPLTYEKNEIKNAWIQIEEREGETFTVDTGAGNTVFDVVDGEDVVKQASADATVSDNNTALVKVRGLVDTTVAGFVDGSSYKIRFTVTIGSEVLKGHIPMKVGEEKL